MEEYTFQFRDDGIVLNADMIDYETPFVDIDKVSGLAGAELRTTERAREGQDGGFADAEFENMRTVVLEGTVYALPDTLETYLDQLKGNFAPVREPQPFYFHPAGTADRVLFCKSYGIKYDWDTARRTGTTPIQITLIAEDPTIYDAVPVTDSADLSSMIVGGRGYNKSYNITYGGSDVTGGFASIRNVGNKDTGAFITIFGPITNPSIIHDTSGKQLSFNIDISSDQFLTIDLRQRLVMLNGTANRRHTLVNTSQWFMLPPGDNSLRLLGTDPIGGVPDPKMTVVARGAYR
jgi:hypothetical protein